MMTMLTRKRCSLLLLLVAMSTCLGCINFAANMIHAITGNMKPADYDGLKGQRVAIVCVSDDGMGTDATSAMLTSYIHAALNANVKKIDVVRQSEVERWLDSHGSSDADYLEVGKGVKADRVLAIEVLNMRLKNGATLFQGKSDITVTVYDVKEEGRILYRNQIPEFAFPKMGGSPITEVSEAKFRARYLAIVAKTISGLFFETDATAEFALDATASSF
jgi:hypothetical protein